MNGLFGWFDVVAAAVLVFGIFLGRRRGMSAELLGLLMWAAIIGLGGFFHAGFGRWLVKVSGLTATTCYIGAYLLIAGGLWGLVLLVRQQFGDKLVSGDAFGGYEYYLGMVGGLLRAACVVVFALALLHAPRTTRAELDKALKAQQTELGSVYFPPFGQIQRDIFDQSIVGKLARKHIPFLLIEPSAKASGGSRESIGRARESMVNEIIGR